MFFVFALTKFLDQQTYFLLSDHIKQSSWKMSSWQRKDVAKVTSSSGFLSLRFFGLSSSSLLLFSQRFGRYVLRPSSGVCRTREPSRNFELRTLLKPRGSPVLIPFAMTGYKCVKYSCILLTCSEDWNVVEITIKMKTIVRKTLMTKINKLRLRQLLPDCT